ncbi:hypothetical protein ELI49_03010 [Rhizobium ruizarguesonis]|nr:hypothetical protein ELI49_03010 [Rhizobium ruizarguesonis]TAW76289.1 hypothetical protein ELI10_03170 [Rhizobium ruizarguesonis]TAX13243.1 hypothetical protein ELI09_03175 [Rhizobium ruizarguesonis]TAX18075.1 hypothetical protein ELI08_03165 [Rhizobium ruizarguesonis]
MSSQPKPAWTLLGKTGFAGSLIRPTGTFSPLGGIETLRHALRLCLRRSKGRHETRDSTQVKMAMPDQRHHIVLRTRSKEHAFSTKEKAGTCPAFPLNLFETLS